jgi:hypothetical protein
VLMLFHTIELIIDSNTEFFGALKPAAEANDATLIGLAVQLLA